MMVWTPETGSVIRDNTNPLSFAAMSYGLWIKQIIRAVKSR
jgi:hypothetical protein